jgi:hypothetical protein
MSDMPFVFRCPTTGEEVQGFVAEETHSDDPDANAPLTCLSCGQIHLINLKTRKIAGEENEH